MSMRKSMLPEKTPSMRSKAPWKPGERICSLEELYRAADIRLSRKVPISKYFRDLEETLEKAKRRLMEQDLQYAYVFYLRYVTVVVKHLPSMPNYDNPEYAKNRERTSKNAKKALTVLERLQPILQERYDEYIKYLSSLPRPKAEVSTYSTRHGLNDHKVSFANVPSHDERSNTTHDNQPNDDSQSKSRNFSLAETFQGLQLNGNSTPHIQLNVREETPIIYPSVSASTSDLAQSAQPHSTQAASTHATHPPAPQQQPLSAYTPTSPNPAFASVQMPVPRPPPRDNPNKGQPTLPPKPQEYGKGTIKNNIASESQYMPPSFIHASHSSLTEGGVRMRPIQVPEGIFEEFIEIASANTRANLETCGILCGKQIPGQEALVMTTLIIPKQRATSDTCVTEHEEELFVEQMERDLITLGWIHTHPSQTCFMSSLDLHTQCSYQLMLPEAIAIVCSPQHQPRFGIFRLTDPGGIDTIQNCHEKSAFHPHDSSKIIYTNASDGSHVVLANYDFDIVDIRGVA
ncbi:hypothetical protein IWW36_001858 [Coemansia brasiliensis]|uniref:MPN domain-containing protein n=1 Tax=Coemansia brasiliensis TaxID=2650707 RepID=A0A9W8M1K8_9FUNG|nr:hypothetical protein IWW36_001858 [Coemansia brasiliensis]